MFNLLLLPQITQGLNANNAVVVNKQLVRLSSHHLPFKFIARDIYYDKYLKSRWKIGYFLNKNDFESS